MSNNRWTVEHILPKPLTFRTRELTNQEKSDSTHRKCKGVKTFYFLATHIGGKVNINPDLYDDYVWSSKLEFNKYLDEETYNKFIHITSLY